MKGKPINQSFKLLLDDLRNRIQDLAMSPGGVMFWRGQLGNVFHRNSNWTDFCGKVLDSKDSLEIFGDLFHMFFFYAFKSRSKSAGSLAVGACLSLLLDIGLISDFGSLKICHAQHFWPTEKVAKKKKNIRKRVPKMASLTSQSPHFLASFHRQGEWVCAQASKDVGTANWVCVEHRPVGAVTKWKPTDFPQLTGLDYRVFLDPGLNWDPFQGESKKLQMYGNFERFPL